jgi:hypothetical protein
MKPDPPREPGPAIRRFKAGHRLALATALLLIIGAVAKATGAPSWLVAVLWAALALALVAGIACTRGMAGWVVIVLMAMSAATSVIAAIRIVPTVIAIRRLGEREKRRQGRLCAPSRPRSLTAVPFAASVAA